MILYVFCIALFCLVQKEQYELEPQLGQSKVNNGKDVEMYIASTCTAGLVRCQGLSAGMVGWLLHTTLHHKSLKISYHETVLLMLYIQQ